MAIEKKERYIVCMRDGKGATVVAASFQECLQMFGEENVEMIRVLDYDEPKEE